VELPGPIDVPASVEIFRRNGDDGIDRWDGVHLVRTIRVDGRLVAYACTPAGTVDRPLLRIIVEDLAHRDAVQAAIRSTFVLPPAEFADLLRADPVVARLNALFPGVRPVLQHDLLASIVRCISAQQVNLRWAATTRRRLAEAFGHKHIVDGHDVYGLDPDRLAAADPSEIRAIQFTNRKAEYIVAAAQAVASGRLDLARLRELADEEVISELTSLRGIGLWTAEWILARTLGRPRVVAGDLGARKAVGLAYLGTPLPSEQEVRSATAHWGPSAGVAQQLLLHALSHGALEGSRPGHVAVTPRSTRNVSEEWRGSLKGDKIGSAE
jgi:DNA-3-methyladenine glycosylase II